MRYDAAMNIELERTITVGEYIAELLENEANRMPPSYKIQADILREQAKISRESKNPNLVRIWKKVGYPPTPLLPFLLR
jgi:tRNA(Ser,Leu) C12 N-acetylase TAN1